MLNEIINRLPDTAYFRIDGTWLDKAAALSYTREHANAAIDYYLPTTDIRLLCQCSMPVKDMPFHAILRIAKLYGYNQRIRYITPTTTEVNDVMNSVTGRDCAVWLEDAIQRQVPIDIFNEPFV